MTVNEALKKYKDIESELLLGAVLKQSKEFLYIHPEKKLTAAQLKKFQALAKSRANGMPVAYLLGYKNFYGLEFKVNKHVLIPRPETEWLVEKTLSIVHAKRAKSKTQTIRILDLATGSGCIAISIAKFSKDKNIEVTASDVSLKALDVAKTNARKHKVKIKFIKSNLFNKIQGKFDVVIANLPYVPASDYKKFYPNLKFEPKLALTDGTDKFILLNKFLEQAPKFMNQRAVTLMEVDPKFFKGNKHKKWRIVKDIHALDRFALMKTPSLDK